MQKRYKVQLKQKFMKTQKSNESQTVTFIEDIFNIIQFDITKFKFIDEILYYFGANTNCYVI